jgi:type IV pilus assembly protein PilO
LASVLSGLGLILFVFWFDTREQLTCLERSQHQESELRLSFKTKQREVLEQLADKAQLFAMDHRAVHLLKELPSRTDMPALLDDISQQGLHSGLEFHLFKPLPEVVHPLYVELPIQLEVSGNYHQLATFVSHVSMLSRIMSVNNFKLTRMEIDQPKETDRQPQLTTSANRQTDIDPTLKMAVMVSTYRYQDDPHDGVARAQTSMDPTPMVKAQKTFVYDRQNKRSPFKPLATDAVSASPPDFGRAKEPLEAFALDSLTWVGHLEKNKTTWAIILAPDGMVHDVTIGGHLGQHFGTVVNMTNDRLDLVERVSMGEGAWEERPTSMTMKQKY